MIKVNSFGIPTIYLFSHDLVKQYQEYELRGQPQRCFPPILHKLLGKTSEDAYGRVHVEWRKKAIKSFKPEIVNQYTPFIQQAANDIVLSGIAEETQKTGKSIYFCELAKQFAFQIGVLCKRSTSQIHLTLG